MRILVCDDDGAVGSRITCLLQQHCQENGITAQIQACAQPRQLELEEPFDIAFLDIDMPEENGIQLARRLRSARADCIIIFVTNFIQYAPEGYEVGAFRYLLKSDVPAKLPQYFSLALEELRRRRRVLTIQINAEHIDLPVARILYLESDRRMIQVHLLDQQRTGYQFYGSMADLEQKLALLGFLRIHKSFLVNMEHIERFQHDHVRLKGGVWLPISEKKYAELKQRYLQWEGENKWSIC